MTLPPTMARVITSAMISAQRRFPDVARPYSGGEARPSFFLKNTAKPMSVAAAAMYMSMSIMPQTLPVLYRPFSSKADMPCIQRQNIPKAPNTQVVQVSVSAYLRIWSNPSK